MRYFYKFFSFGLLFLVVHSADAMRCDGKIIKEGEYQFNVLAHCGEPAYKKVYPREITVEREIVIKDNPFNDANKGDPIITEHKSTGVLTRHIMIEEWYYNFGPNKFIQKLTFVEGNLEKIESAGYGFKE